MKNRNNILVLLLLYFLLPCNAFSNNVINGVLIEGIDFSGKTTISEKLEKKLREYNIQIKRNHGQLTDSKIGIFLIKAAFNSFPNILPAQFPDANFLDNFIKIRTAQLLVDTYVYNDIYQLTVNKEKFWIQDRYLLSHKCTKEFFQPNINIPELQILENKAPTFRYNVYLTCNLEERKNRIHKRKNHKNLDTLELYLIKNIEKLPQYDNYCKSLIKDKSNWVIIDNSYISSDEAVNKILHFIGHNKDKIR